MRNAIVISCFLCAAGCAAEPLDTTDFSKGQAPAAFVPPSYPSDADWGVKVGQVIPNYVMIGLANSQDASLQGVQQLSLADFYNPTGNGVFPDGHPFAGKPKPKALSLGVAAVWCGPCNQEAKTELNPKFDEYKPKGGHFMNALVDGPIPGKGVKLADVQKWATAYKVAYSMMLDQNHQFEQMFEPLLPSNAVVTTKDMKIQITISGAPIDPKSTPQPCVAKNACVGADPLAKVCSNDAQKSCTADADCGTAKVCNDYPGSPDKNTFACVADADCHICVRQKDNQNCKYWATFEKALSGG